MIIHLNGWPGAGQKVHHSVNRAAEAHLRFRQRPGSAAEITKIHELIAKFTLTRYPFCRI
jgi:hypothetical protein